MVRCFCCDYFLGYEKVAEMDKHQYDAVPEAMIESLSKMKLSCKAFPDGIPDEFFRLQNEKAFEQAVPCANGYAYHTVRNIIECVGPSQAMWKLLWNGRNEREEYDKKLRHITDLVHKYICFGPGWVNRQMFPWEHIGKEFSKLLSPPVRTSLVAFGGSIFRCFYGDTAYLFGIGLPIPVVTDDMLEKGEWYVYTWGD